jgi:hypothetical protein
MDLTSLVQRPGSRCRAFTSGHSLISLTLGAVSRNLMLDWSLGPLALRWQIDSGSAALSLSLWGFAVPPRHVLCMGAQVGARVEETVIEVEVEIMGLAVVQDEHGRHRAGELAEGVEDVLRLQRHTSFECLVMDLSTSTDAWAVRPGARVSRLNGPPGPNLRIANASTATAMLGWCGGQYASKTP